MRLRIAKGAKKQESMVNGANGPGGLPDPGVPVHHLLLAGEGVG